MKRIYYFLLSLIPGRRERAGKHLDDLMAEGEPGWGWRKTNAKLLFEYICTQGAVKVPLDKVPLWVIDEATKKYRLACLFEGRYVWVGNDMRFILDKIRRSNRSRQAI